MNFSDSAFLIYRAVTHHTCSAPRAPIGAPCSTPKCADAWVCAPFPVLLATTCADAWACAPMKEQVMTFRENGVERG